jgi:hypothetical protein
MLLMDTQSVRDRLTRMEQAKTSVEEATALSVKGNDITRWSAKVQKLSERNRLLIKNNVVKSTKLDVSSVLQIIDLSTQRFAESTQSSTLVAGQRWTRLGGALDALSTSLETLQRQDWLTHFANKLFAGVHPDKRKQTIVQSMPENIAALQKYTQLYERFNKYRNALPTKSEEFDEVLLCSEQLAKIKFQENDDVPGPVKAFFNATSSGSGANIDLLSVEVVEWLRTNNMLDNYVVRSR